MKNSTASNRKTGRMIAKNLIILVVLVFVAILAMWAWFTNNSSATADGINVTCKAPDAIEFAVVAPGVIPTDDDYVKNTDEFFRLTKQTGNFLEKLSLSEVTSDGVNFYRPVLNQTGGVARPDTRPQVKWSKANHNESYLSFDIYFRSNKSYTVYMNKGSYFKAQSEVEEKKLTGSDAGNISTFGNFSKDCVVGAARLSIVAADTTLQYLWIPRPDIMFSSDSGNTVATGVKTGDTYKHYYYTNADSTTEEKIKTEFSGDKLITSAFDEDTDQYVLPQKMVLTTLTDKESDNYFYNHVTCNIWIDGEDSEARLALVKGQFVVNLDLTVR